MCARARVCVCVCTCGQDKAVVFFNLRDAF